MCLYNISRSPERSPPYACIIDCPHHGSSRFRPGRLAANVIDVDSPAGH